MLKKEIKYVDFDGNPQTEVAYFNITKAELMELELSTNEGFGETLKQIIASNKLGDLVNAFRKIILTAYGVRSEDGKFFRKSKEIQDDFAATAAYDVVFMEFVTNDAAAIEFIRNIIPKDMVAELDKEIKMIPNSPLTTSATLPEALTEQ